VFARRERLALFCARVALDVLASGRSISSLGVITRGIHLHAQRLSHRSFHRSAGRTDWSALYPSWVGVAKAGYTLTEELPIFLFIFGAPTIAAIFLKWRVF
jgi:hypothetical protein